MPKRKLEEVDGVESDGVVGPSEGSGGESGECGQSEDSNSSIQTNSSTDVPISEAQANQDGYCKVRKRSKKNVKFEGVTVYYFQRKQGFVCVPSQGGSTLGMTDAHISADNFSVKEYSQLQRQIHRQILAQQHGGKLPVSTRDRQLKEKQKAEAGKNMSSSSDSESSEDDLNVDDYYFLQPVPTRQRRLMLRQAGIKKIDTLEKEECKDIRTSRESCGCDCRVYCDPETCSCSLAGIKCQVDRLSFPCGCTKEGCGNLSGRIEFNPIRVRTHFIHTLMRIEMDKKQEEEQALRAQRLKENGPSRAESSPVCPELSDPDPPGVRPSEESDPEDITKYNSNERGSCCDCQNSDIHEFMMQESQFNGGMNTGSLTMPAPGPSHDHTATTSMAPMDPSTSSAPSADSGEKVVPQHLLFNDSEDEYSGENSASMYPFNKEESSYSESSDCSSEGSVAESDQSGSGAGYQSFPQGSQVYDNGLNATQNSSYCIPHASSSTTQPEQKFMDLSEPGSAYKLEPISEILNPIRFPGYSQGQNGSWAQCGESFQSYDSSDQSSSQMPATDSAYVMNDDSQSSKSTSSYLYPAEHQATPTTDSMTCIMTTPQELPEAYLEQSYENGHSDSLPSQGDAEKDLPVDAKHLNGADGMTRSESEELQYHDLSNSTSSSQDLSKGAMPNPTSASNPTSFSGSLAEVNGNKSNGFCPLISQTTMANGEGNLHQDHPTSSQQVYLDLSNPVPSNGQEVGTSSSESTSAGATSVNGHSSQYKNLPLGCVGLKGCSVALGERVQSSSEALPDLYTLQSQQSVYAVAANHEENNRRKATDLSSSSPSSSSSSSSSTSSTLPSHSQTNDTKGIPGAGGGGKFSPAEEAESATQNFGEIIKESIVETVSA